MSEAPRTLGGWTFTQATTFLNMVIMFAFVVGVFLQVVTTATSLGVLGPLEEHSTLFAVQGVVYGIAALFVLTVLLSWVHFLVKRVEALERALAMRSPSAAARADD